GGDGPRAGGGRHRRGGGGGDHGRRPDRCPGRERSGARLGARGSPGRPGPMRAAGPGGAAGGGAPLVVAGAGGGPGGGAGRAGRAGGRGAGMRPALYYPWVYLKGGAERVLVELMTRSRHDWTLYTNHFEPHSTFPEFSDLQVEAMADVSVRRNLWHVSRAG